jgi:general secretion pathway protein D
VPGPSNSLAYQIGSRSAETSLRLRDGETQILAGLISDEERSTANKVPGLGDLPVLGRLFSSQADSKNKTEIVLLITPRVLRNVARPESSAPAVPSGTESAIGAAPLTIKPGALRGMAAIKGGGAAAGRAAPSQFASESPASVEPEQAELKIMAPPEAKAGQSISVTLSVASVGGASGQVELVADPKFFETPGATVALSGAGGALQGSATLKLKTGITAGEAQIDVGSASATDANGAPLALVTPTTQVVRVLP